MTLITGTRKNGHHDSSEINFGSGAGAQEHAHNPGDVIGTQLELNPVFSQLNPVLTTTPPNEAMIWNEIMLQAIALSSSGPAVATGPVAIESLGHEPPYNASNDMRTKPEPPPVDTSPPNEAIVWNEITLQASALGSSDDRDDSRSLRVPCRSIHA